MFEIPEMVTFGYLLHSVCQIQARGLGRGLGIGDTLVTQRDRLCAGHVVGGDGQ